MEANMKYQLKFGVLKQYFIWNVLMIVVIIGLIGLILMGMITNMVEKEMSDINVQRLTYVNSIVELGVLEPAEKVVLEQLLAPQNLDFSGGYSHVEAHRQLKKLIAVLPFVESLNIYYPEERMLISSRGIKYDYQSTDTNKFVDHFMTDREGHKKWFPFNEKADLTFERTGEVTSYARASALKQDGEPVFILYINIYSKYMSNMLRSQLINPNEAILILNHDNEIIVQSDPSARYAMTQANDLIEASQKEDKQLNIREINGQNVMLLNHTSSYNDWTYTLIMPLSDFFRVSSYIQNIIIYVSLGTLIVGLLVALFVAINQYRPIKQIIAHLLHTSGTHELNGNAYAFINDTIKNMHVSVNALRMQVNKSRLNQLLRGIIDDESNAEISHILHEEQSVVAAFQINELDMNESVFEQLEYAVVQSGLMTDYNVLITSYSKDIIVVVINFKTDENVVFERIELATSLLAGTFAFPIRVGAGSIVRGLGQLHSSCEQALRALKHHFLTKEKSVVLYSSAVASMGEFRIPELYRQLVQAFEAHNVQEIHRLLDCIAVKLCKQSCRIESVELIIHQIMQLVTQKMMEAEPKSGESMLVYKNVPEEFYGKGDIFEALEWLKTFIADIFSLHVEENTNHILMQSVKSYIDTHYHEEISLELLSQKTFISATYISALFKKTFHIGVSEYVSELRMMKAKELLESSNLKVEEIAGKVGMTNSTYFITRFKRRFGMTPNQYKLHVRSSEIKELRELKEVKES